MMGNRSKLATPQTSDSENGDVFTDGDFDECDEDISVSCVDATIMPINNTTNIMVRKSEVDLSGGNGNGADGHSNVDRHKPAVSNGVNGNNGYTATNGGATAYHSSHDDFNPGIVGFIGNQHTHAEQRLAARRAARAEAREIRMRELERQQREHEDHADRAYDMHAEPVVCRRGTRVGALGPAGALSPRRSSEDSAEDSLSAKDLRYELKEVEEKFRKAMILNAQLDNDKAALGYQRELLTDRIEELREEFAQLQREHKEKCSAHERLKREHVSLERELCGARDGVRARDAAATAAGQTFVEAEGDEAAAGEWFGSVPPLALVSRESEQLLSEAGEGTLDVRLQRLLSTQRALQAEVRGLKLQLNDERAARQNGAALIGDQYYEDEMEALRKSASEAKSRAARAEAEAALQGASAARAEAQLARLRAQQLHQDEHEEQLKQERRRLQREAREAINRVEELETENRHLTKRLDKLKNAKSALLKEL